MPSSGRVSYPTRAQQLGGVEGRVKGVATTVLVPFSLGTSAKRNLKEGGEIGPEVLPFCSLHPPSSSRPDVSPAAPAPETLGHFPQAPPRQVFKLVGVGKRKRETISIPANSCHSVSTPLGNDCSP